MKSRIKSFLVLSLLTALIYAGCTKNYTGPSPVTADTEIVAGKVAATLYNGLKGSLGGINLSNGINVPAGYGVLLCGFSIDTALSYNSSVDTLTAHATGRFKFSFLCNANQPYGFNVSDTLANIGSSQHTTFSYLFSEHLVVTAVNPAATMLSASGSLLSFGDIRYNDARLGLVSEHDSFILSGMHIDLTNNVDLPSGTATFTTLGTTASGNWNYSGTITFIGSHMITETINGTTFHVDLLTGKVTP